MPMPRIPISLPKELLEQIDDAREDVSRAQWIRRACENRLRTETNGPFAVSRVLDPVRIEKEAQASGQIIRHLAASETMELGIAPLPCQCGGKIYQVGAKKGRCSKCTKPRPG